MAKKIAPYKRIPGRGTGLANYCTLWMGPDHLLSIDCNHFSEEYKRFYYTDIQSLTIHKTDSGRICNGIFFALGAFCLFWSFVMEGYWSYFWLVGSSTLFFFVLCNTILGPTCTCHIKTAVQTEKLPSLGRLRRARKTTNRLRSLIEQAQGSIDADELNAVLAAEEEGPVVTTKPPNQDVPVMTTYGGTAHAIMFALLLVNAFFTGLDLSFTHVGFTAAGFGAVLITGIVVIVALVKQHQNKLPQPIGALTWWTLGYVAVTFFAWYALTIVFSIVRPEVMRDQWLLLQNIAETSPWEQPLFAGFMLFSLGTSLILGLLGLMALRKISKDGQAGA